MEIQDAIKVIRALADGVHPETREVLRTIPFAGIRKRLWR